MLNVLYGVKTLNNFHPLVTIVIPVYNGSNFLQCAIDSALSQDYDNIEVIVVNDGSTDNTDEIAKSYGNKIRYFSKENGGVSTALNLAIQNAKGEYISWLSHDDYYLPNKISRQIEELKNIKNNEKIILYSNVKIINTLDKIESLWVNGDKNGISSKYESIKSLFQGQIHGCSLLIPIFAFHTIGFFDAKLLVTQDYDLWFKFIKEGYLLHYIPEILLITRWHVNQHSRNKNKNENKEDKRLWKNAKKYFYIDIKNAPKTDKIIFKKEVNILKTINHKIKKIIKKTIFWNIFKNIYYKIKYNRINY